VTRRPPAGEQSGDVLEMSRDPRDRPGVVLEQLGLHTHRPGGKDIRLRVVDEQTALRSPPRALAYRPEGLRIRFLDTDLVRVDDPLRQFVEGVPPRLPLPGADEAVAQNAQPAAPPQ